MTPEMLATGTGPATSGTSTWNNANGTGTVTCSSSASTCGFDGVPELSPFGTTPSGDWKILQFYKFVTGKQLTGTYTWDCSASNPNDHWTSNTELYCYNDALTIMGDLQAEVAGGVNQMVTPGYVADNWTGTDPVTGLTENLWHGVTPSCADAGATCGQ